MGRLDQYAKEIFAEETPAVTHGGAVFRPPVELNLSEVRLDGSLLVEIPARLQGLAMPWPLAGEHDEIVLEIKMQGDHLDMRAAQRGLLRRQARQVHRMENPRVAWDGDMPLWMVASHVPSVLHERRSVREVAPGCYWIETGWFQFLWIAANELPLCEELVPFLMARRGRALDDFVRWTKRRRPRDWLFRMVEFLPMSTALYNEMFRFALEKTDDPDVLERKKIMGRVLFDMTPELREELAADALKIARDEVRNESRVVEARSALRRVLARRKLVVGAEEQAHIDACQDLATLERWLEQAVDASSVAEALR